MKYFVHIMGTGANCQRMTIEGSVLAVGAVSDDGRRGVEISAQENNRARGGEATWGIRAVDASGLLIQPVANNTVNAIPEPANPILLHDWDQAHTLDRALKAERLLSRLLNTRSKAERYRLVDALVDGKAL